MFKPGFVRRLLTAVGWGAVALGAVGGLLLASVLIRLSQRGPQVEAAVRGTYPYICSEWRDELEIKPAFMGWYITWEVNCRKGYWPGTMKLFIVNVLTCQSRRPVQFEAPWRTVLADIMKPSAPMLVCP
jgi:hypothetical protein